MRSLIRIFDFHAPLPCDLADGIEHALDFGVERVAEAWVPNSRPGSISAAFSSTVMPGLASDVAQNPALALGHGLVAELLDGHFVAPLAERALSELLDVALVHQRDGLAAGLERVADGVAHQPLGAEDGDGLDAHAGVGADLFLAALEQVVVQERDQPRRIFACPV